MSTIVEGSVAPPGIVKAIEVLVEKSIEIGEPLKVKVTCPLIALSVERGSPFPVIINASPILMSKLLGGSDTNRGI